VPKLISVERYRARAETLTAASLAFLTALPVAAIDPRMSLEIANRAGNTISSVSDGNAIKLRAMSVTPASQPTEMVFHLDADEPPIARCTIPRGGDTCETAELRALGWYWTASGQPKPDRTLSVRSLGGEQQATLEIRVTARPVVLVHGLIANDKTWLAYTRSDGFLAPLGLEGFAVGDGKAEGVINAGDLARPTTPTKTLPENAASLGRYIAGVKRSTGAEMVDLVAHSMGGLIARYYIARLMPIRDVAQLLMLGPPHGGSDCSGLASALGFLGPASLELRPAYLRRIFNPTVTHRNGVPFYMLAGDPIVEGFKAPCSGVPSDSVVGLDSASAIPGRMTKLPVLHTDMTRSEAVFRKFVLPHLQQRAGEFPRENDPEVAADASVPTQFTQVFKGRVEAGGTTDVDVNLDQVAIASFALFDSSRSLDVTVRGASGNVITLTPEQHGLIKVEDPTSLVYLGYGFQNPKPGPWKVTLRASPRSSAEFALSARVIGGAVLHARASEIAPTRRDTVTLFATLELPGKSLEDVSVEALVHAPNGRSEKLDFRAGGATMTAAWRPGQAGIHGIDVVAKARSDGLRIERTTFLAIEVQP
jgi:pimeloyl-ACP methyl ester carboxylesterase